MTAEHVFSIVNPAALLGWVTLIYAIVRRNNWLRDEIAGRFWPLALSALYLVLMLFFFGKAEGGFDSLANVQKLFTSPWVALAGWVHYLAFDLFIGAWIARQHMMSGLPGWPLVVILPLTFLFGPIGYVAFEVSRLMLSPVTRAQDALS
jgi:Domain of unknown function (DUF4281)